ncbi:Linoleate 9S-lipoxygenase 1-like protein [Cladobotryum mycophilum]|uniref:Manganese lipoxygenase n=1 Tax=Cladobotryum mycophilum TaxID=491253 RepID=A0ABR0SA57_9HYPO
MFSYLHDLHTRKSILKQPSARDRKKELEAKISHVAFTEIDPGVLNSRLVTWMKHNLDGDDEDDYSKNLHELSYQETQAAITQLYDRIEKSFGSYFDVLEIEPSWPRFISLEEKRKMYQFSAYPRDEISPLDIFNKLGLAQTGKIIERFIPKTWTDEAAQWVVREINGDVSGAAEQAPSMEAFEEYNKSHRKSGTDIKQGRNIGLLEDWYSDRRFAEQSFTGTNPTTIEKVPEDLLAEFIETAKREGYEYWTKTLPKIDPASLFVQDCRYFREAIGAQPDEELKHQEPLSELNWACAAVTLFQLHDTGRLHPIAIVVDYKTSMKNSVTIFNKSQKPSEPDSDADPIEEEASDWPWRYAKTCAQVSDWIRHEAGVHLTRAHFIEEAIIVATHRTIPMDHIIFKLLEPHWYKTLSLNAAARATLVPQVIKELLGLKPDYLYQFIRSEYTNLNYVDHYIPNDLKKRGFPNTVEELGGEKYKNYAYAKNMLDMWNTIRQYVKGMLLTHYDEETADKAIAADPYIADWTKEVRENGWIKTFPVIQTLDDLTDAITMSIHIAAPFHTAVNYLQNFYQAFVPSKPPALCQPLPENLDELRGYTEDMVVKALPIGRQRQWMLAVQVPWLLSFKVSDDRSLLSFAQSQWQIHNGPGPRNEQIRGISTELYKNLYDLSLKFIETSQGMDVGSVPYMVMDPSSTAVSILI